MTEHLKFEASHPRVKVWNDGRDIGLLNEDGSDGEKLTPDEACALGYALFSIGLTLKQSKG